MRRQPRKKVSQQPRRARGTVSAHVSRPVEQIAARIASNQQQMESLSAREEKLQTELDKVLDEKEKLSKSHADLLRQLDKTVDLPRFDG